MTNTADLEQMRKVERAAFAHARAFPRSPDDTGLELAGHTFAVCEQLREAADALASLSRRLEAYKALCLEAAELYGSGGTFPINGEMSQRLELAGQGVVLSTADVAREPADKGSEGL